MKFSGNIKLSFFLFFVGLLLTSYIEQACSPKENNTKSVPSQDTTTTASSFTPEYIHFSGNGTYVVYREANKPVKTERLN